MPGSYWTAERSREAAGRMTATFESPELQASMQEAAAEPEQANAVAAIAAGIGASARTALDGVRTADVLYRRGQREDVPAIAELMAQADLPPLFIEEFVEGFVVADCAGQIAGAGGAELYGDAAVIRSVAVDEAAQGLGIGRRMAELLIEDMWRSGVYEIYIFTAQAHGFWRHLGFEDVTFDEWPPEPRASWQYRFLSTQREMVAAHGVRSMRLRA